ncbi:hypothetical protein HG531_006350 [Fusarium graminearum]|nr:hypothetical protein HG531_006350 [Fusarium graminearum]
MLLLQATKVSGNKLEVERSTEEVLVLLIGNESNAVGSQGSTTIADDGSLAVLTLLFCAVLVEDAAVLLGDTKKGEAGSCVDAGELEVLDGRIKVQRRICDVDDKLEAL